MLPSAQVISALLFVVTPDCPLSISEFEIDIFVPHQIALLSSTESPFKIFQMLMESRTQAPAKGGETATSKIVVEKGPTAFPAGPVVGDFQKAGFPAAIEKGKVVMTVVSLVLIY